MIIIDRVPCNKHLMIDLSQSAAKEIGILGAGIASVEMTYELPGNKLANKNKAKEDSDI